MADEYNDVATNSNFDERQMDTNDLDDPELINMRQRLREMEEEAAKLKEMQAQVEKELAGGDEASKEEIDARSIFVGNVDYSSTVEELQQHFASCGTINRVTILTDKFSGHPKGFAYVEFADVNAVAHAMMLNESLFRGRLIKVTSKRTNVPGLSRGRGRGRGRGGMYAMYGMPMPMPMMPMMPFRGARRPYRASRRGFYQPY